MMGTQKSKTNIKRNSSFREVAQDQIALLLQYKNRMQQVKRTGMQKKKEKYVLSPICQSTDYTALNKYYDAELTYARLLLL